MLLKYKDNWNWGEGLSFRIWEETPMPSIPASSELVSRSLDEKEKVIAEDTITELVTKLNLLEGDISEKDEIVNLIESVKLNIIEEAEASSVLEDVNKLQYYLERVTTLIESQKSRSNVISSRTANPVEIKKEADFAVSHIPLGEKTPEALFVQSKIDKLVSLNQLINTSDVVFTKGGNLNLRTKEGKVIGSLKNGSSLILTGQTSVMRMKNKEGKVVDLPVVEVKQGKLTGFVAAHYLKGFNQFDLAVEKGEELVKDVQNVASSASNSALEFFDKWKNTPINGAVNSKDGKFAKNPDPKIHPEGVKVNPETGAITWLNGVVQLIDGKFNDDILKSTVTNYLQLDEQGGAIYGNGVIQTLDGRYVVHPNIPQPYELKPDGSLVIGHVKSSLDIPLLYDLGIPKPQVNPRYEEGTYPLNRSGLREKKNMH